MSKTLKSPGLATALSFIALSSLASAAMITTATVVLSKDGVYNDPRIATAIPQEEKKTVQKGFKVASYLSSVYYISPVLLMVAAVLAYRGAPPSHIWGLAGAAIGVNCILRIIF